MDDFLSLKMNPIVIRKHTPIAMVLVVSVIPVASVMAVAVSLVIIMMIFVSVPVGP
jgi:hypothetical protein